MVALLGISKLDSPRSSRKLWLSCAKFTSAVVGRNADVSSIDFENVYAASNRRRLASCRLKVNCRDWYSELPPLSVIRMLLKAGYGTGDKTAPGPGIG